MEHFKRLSFFGFFLLFSLSNPVFAQDCQTVTVEGKASIGNVTIAEARRLAIEDAMREAVEVVVGVNIIADTLVIDSMTSGDFIRAIPYGKVMEKEVIEEKVEGKTDLALIYRVKMIAKVCKEKGSPDPYFKLQASLNRDVFRENDEVVIKVEPQRDCYLNIFCILEDEKVIILLPNRYKKKNFIKANEIIIFPDEADRNIGMKLRVHGLPGKKSTRETIFILCLKQPLKFDTTKFEEGIYGIYQEKTSFLRDLIKELVEIPLSERAESFIRYEVRSRE